MKYFESLTLEELELKLKEYIVATDGWGLWIDDMENEIERRKKFNEHKEKMESGNYIWMY